ncbi:hypothetical protein [Deinococcus sp. QL22]|uniref:hypothetical protein n=1 Tax=Deinococcus sp. QL22 TaxID=2939437 RepID=UPI002016FD6F|nr:hypothetical protein [Deinococcus sp. QL22]UQN05967.1 hypothetical protein M1R55_14035 [Deinococcus sp. QL22]
MSQSLRTIFPDPVPEIAQATTDHTGTDQSNINQTGARPLTGFEILSGRTTLHGWSQQMLSPLYDAPSHNATLQAPSFPQPAAPPESITSEVGPMPAPGALPDRLREVDLKLAPERELAVDALEIASYLEADGLSDESLRGRYNAGGLFQAAELLFAQRGSGRALNRLPNAPIPAFPWHMLLRGPLYLLPGLAGLMITGPLGQGASAAFTFAAAFGWGWSMTIAGLRYSEPFAVPGRAMRAALWLAGLMGTLGGAVTAFLMAGPDQVVLGVLSGGVVALATASAGILLALGRITLSAGAFAVPLLAATVVQASLLPVVESIIISGSEVASSVASFNMASSDIASSDVARSVVGAAATSPSLVLPLVALALLAVLPVLAVLSATRAPGELRTTWAVFKPHLRLAAYGWAMALTFVAFSSRIGAWPLLPIIVSAGLLEAGVWHAQERLQHAARSLRDLADLRWRGRVTVPVVAVLYSAVLALAVLLIRVTGVLPQFSGIPPGVQVAVALLGAAFLLSAWLANQRQVAALLGLWSVAAMLTFSALIPLPLLSISLVLILLLSALNDPRSYR